MTASKTLLLCSCDKSQTFDSEALRKAAAADQVIAVDQLCGNEMSIAAEHLGASSDVLIACGQQAAFFERLAEDVYAETQHSAPLQSIDIRDRAGWSAPDAKPERLHAKQAGKNHPVQRRVLHCGSHRTGHKDGRTGAGRTGRDLHC